MSEFCSLQPVLIIDLNDPIRAATTTNNLLTLLKCYRVVVDRNAAEGALMDTADAEEFISRTLFY